MKKRVSDCFAVLTVGLLFAFSALAQDNNRITSAAGDIYVISAKAGGVNFVEGKVTVARNNSRSGYLVKGDKLEIGDKVSTGLGGRAEILLNPGSFVRLGENTVFEFITTDLNNVRVKIVSGSAILEVFADEEFRVAIDTPKNGFYAVKSGVYRIDVMANGNGKISVWKGKAQIGEDANAIVKSGKSATAVNGTVAMEKFHRDEKDSLELWSKNRAKELSKINAKLERNTVRNTLINSFNSQRWGFYDSFGLWFFDRFSGYYCFLPFGYGWSSPYGFGYNRDLWYFGLPRYIYQPSFNSGQPVRSGTNNDSGSPRRVSVKEPPPFARVEPSIDRRVTIKDDDFSTRSAPVPAPIRTEVPMSVPRSGTKGNRGNQ